MLRIYPKFRENPWKRQDCTRNGHRPRTKPRLCKDKSGRDVTSNGGRQPFRQVLGGQLTQFFRKNTAICTEKHRKRQSAGHIAHRFGQLGAAQTGQSHRKRQGLPLQKSPDRTGLVDRQTDHLQAFGSMFAPEGFARSAAPSRRMRVYRERFSATEAPAHISPERS